MDIEELAIRHIRGERDAAEQLGRLLGPDEMEALLREVRWSEPPEDDDLFLAPVTGFTAGTSGLGCRGSGDGIVHRAIAGLLPEQGLAVSPADLDDSGAIPFAGGYLVLSVDGLHSRLSRFPFLAGFHAARAALRDILVMGARPLAMTSDIHLADGSDLGSALDLTAGISAVSRLTEVPVAGGSTLRIGGDMVLGTRITGSVGAVGFARVLMARGNIAEGDVLLMTRGAGGGTVATIAIYHGRHTVVRRTLNVDFFRDAGALGAVTDRLHAMVDVTNGGIRGDANDLVTGRLLDVHLDGEALRRTVDGEVLRMLDDLAIDFMGISTDSILVAAPSSSVDDVIDVVAEAGGTLTLVGRVERGRGEVFVEGDGTVERLGARFREEPYTPLKRVVARRETPLDSLDDAVAAAAREARAKMERVVEVVLDGTR